MNKHYHNHDNDDDEKIYPTWFYLPCCDECKQYREFLNIISSAHRSHRTLVTCDYSQTDVKTFNDREVRCSTCRSIDRKLKTHLSEKLKNLANVNKIKRRGRDYLKTDLIQKTETYIL